MIQAPELTGVVMSNLFWLSDEQMERLKPFFPKSHGKPRVDDRRVLSGIIFINRNGLRWCDAPREYGPPKTLYNRWKRWGDLGVFARMMEGLASEGGEEKVVMIDATYLKAHRTASSLRAKKGADDRRGRLIGRTKGGLNTKLHAVTDAKGRPLRFFMTAGQVSDYTGAAALLGSLPAAEWLIADRGYRAGERHRSERTGEGRLVPGCVERQRDTPMHPGPEVARQGRPLRQAPIQAPQPHRDHVRQVEGLAPHRHPLRQVSEGLPLRRRLGRNRPVLALKINESGA